MTRRTLVSPAGRGTTEALALAFEPGAAPGTTPSGDGSPNRNRIAARALYDGSGNAILDNGVPRAAQDVEYDLDGNAVRLPGKLRQTVGASWDALGRMTTFVEGDPKTELGAPAETYRYAADGFRWLRAGADGKATLTLRDAQGRPLAEYVVARGAAGPTLSREYVHALGQVVAERTWTGGTQTTTYHHRDHLGSLRVATDAAGAHADAHDYYPFGGEMGPVASSSRRKFTGHERDEETGLDYMLARYHSPALGRFLSVDPGFDVQPESPQSWNLYGYVRNNPVRYDDPDGALRRDKSGNLVFVSEGVPYQYSDSRGTTTFQNGHLLADDGTAIPAYKNTMIVPQPFDKNFNADCHGVTFADGKYWIDDPQVDKLLTGDGYKATTAPVVGDVAVFRDANGDVKHSMTVTSVDKKGSVTGVSGLGGTEPKSETKTPEAVAKEFNAASVTYYHDPNATHSEREAQAKRAKVYKKKDPS